MKKNNFLLFSSKFGIKEMSEMNTVKKVIHRGIFIGGMLGSSIALSGCQIGSMNVNEAVYASNTSDDASFGDAETVDNSYQTKKFPFLRGTVGFLYNTYDEAGFPISGKLYYAPANQFFVVCRDSEISVILNFNEHKDSYIDFLHNKEISEVTENQVISLDEFRYDSNQGEKYDIWEAARLWNFDACIYDVAAVLGKDSYTLQEVSEKKQKQYIEFIEMPEFSSSEDVTYLQYVPVDELSIVTGEDSRLLRNSDFLGVNQKFYNSITRTTDSISEENNIVSFRDYVLEHSNFFDISLVSFLSSSKAGVLTITDESFQNSISVIEKANVEKTKPLVKQ